MTDHPLAALERLDEIEREHTASRSVPTIALGAASIQVEGRQFCLQCSEPWPCDAAQLARAVRAQQERERVLVEERDRYKRALPDPEKLLALAEWLNIRFPNDSDPEVQTDLAEWGIRIKAALAAAPSREGEA